MPRSQVYTRMSCDKCIHLWKQRSNQDRAVTPESSPAPTTLQSTLPPTSKCSCGVHLCGFTLPVLDLHSHSILLHVSLSVRLHSFNLTSLTSTHVAVRRRFLCVGERCPLVRLRHSSLLRWDLTLNVPNGGFLLCELIQKE